MENYYQQQKIKNQQKINEIAGQLPSWFHGFILYCSMNNTATLTQRNYCYDTRLFLNYLIHHNPAFYGLPLDDIPAELLDQLTLDDFERYVDYLSYYIDENATERVNDAKGKARKIASLRSLFKYLMKKDLLKNNVTALLSTPKINEKSIIYLQPNEAAALLDVVESGKGLTPGQMKYHQRDMLRDKAIITLFLTSGIRVSELVGMNISDISFEELAFRVVRKGGDQVELYFDTEAESALLDYLEQRKERGTYEANAPLFINIHGQRLTTRSVENLVVKYASVAVPHKKITPHKLRSTYGTTLYNESGDIYLVADVLGHKDVNTTRRHYADMSTERRRRASKMVKIREP